MMMLLDGWIRSLAAMAMTAAWLAIAAGLVVHMVRTWTGLHRWLEAALGVEDQTDMATVRTYAWDNQAAALPWQVGAIAWCLVNMVQVLYFKGLMPEGPGWALWDTFMCLSMAVATAVVALSDSHAVKAVGREVQRVRSERRMRGADA